METPPPLSLSNPSPTGDANEPKDELADTKMSFGDHLSELRGRLIKSLLSVVAGFLVVWVFIDDVMKVVRRPYESAVDTLGLRAPLTQRGVGEGFFAYMKVALIVGLTLAAPIVLWQVWAFIAAGLYRRERRIVYRYFPMCVLLFIGGVLFGYTVLLPLGLEYLLGFSDPSVVEPYIGLSEYLGFFAIMTLVLGVAFLFPVAMIGLARAGVVGIDAFKKHRKFVILGIFIVAAVVTPPDPFTQSLLATPLCLLYELGIYFSWLGMGQARPKLDRRVLWRRLRIALIVVLAIFLFRKPLWETWQRNRADGRTEIDTKHGPDISKHVGRLLKSKVLGIFRISGEDTPRRYATLLENRIVLIDEVRERVQEQVLDEGERHLTVSFAPAGELMHHFRVPKDPAILELEEPLLLALETGSEATRDLVRRLLRTLTRLEPSGDLESELLAFRQWFDVHRTDHLSQ